MKIFVFLLLAFFSHYICAQPVVTDLVDFSFGQSYTLSRFIDSDETGFYISSNKSDSKLRTYYIEKRNKQTGKIMFVINLENKPYYSYFIEDKLVVIYSELFESNESGIKGRKLFCSIFSSSNGYKVKDIDIDEVSGPKFSPYSKNYHIISSPDKTKILIFVNNNTADYSRKDDGKSSIKMYDSKSMTLIWELSEEINLSEDAVIDNNGNILCPFIDKVGVVKYKSSYRKDINLSLVAPQLLSTSQIHFAANGEVIIAGVFIEKSISPKVKDKGGWVDSKDIIYGKAGFYFSKINLLDLKLIDEKVTIFNTEVEQKLGWQDKGHFVNKNAGGKHYNVLNIVSENGSTYLIAEHNWENSLYLSQYPENPGPYVERKELIITKFSNSGSIEWTKLLPRNTASKSENFHFFTNSVGFNFIYLDIDRNEKHNILDAFSPEKLTVVTRLNKTNAICITVDRNGLASKTMLNIKDDFFLFPRAENLKLDNKTLLIYLIREEETKLATLKFD